MSKLNWDLIFKEIHIHSWPIPSISIQNRCPPGLNARNIFQDDRREILQAAKTHGYKLISKEGAGVMCFLKILT